MTDHTTHDKETSNPGRRPGREPEVSHRAIQRISHACDEHGLDLVAPFDSRWYHEARPEGPELPTFDREGALGLLIGNTRALWPHFLDALADHPERLEAPDPLDTWIESCLQEVLEPIEVEHRILWAHEPVSAGNFLPVQAIAEVAGLATVSPSQLAIHPEYGPWLALRAVVAFDLPGPGGPAPEPERPCRDCSAPCVDALDRALDADESDESAGVRESWRRWVDVRDACPVGREHRYSDAQIRYHYQKDRDFLAELVERRQSE